MRRVLAVVLSFILILAAVAVTRAMLLKPIPRGPVPPADSMAIDQSGAIQRLAASIRIPTVSNASLTIDSDAIAKLRDLLQTSFPRVHAATTREVLPSGSLLYTWKGLNPSADPVILMGHMDVVPIDPATLSR